MEDPKRALCQLWVHSHEEDTDTEMVFRPARYKLPPSRGRLSFELKPDGSLVRRALGPTDRSQDSEGAWRLDDDQLVLTSLSETASDQVMTILSTSADRLVVQKPFTPLSAHRPP